METRTGVIIGVSVVLALGAVVTGVILYKKNTKATAAGGDTGSVPSSNNNASSGGGSYTPPSNGGGSKQSPSVNTNFASLQKKLNLDADSSGVVSYNFNGGKNTIQFYSNNRYVVFDSNKKIVSKGNYADGGSTLKTDDGTTYTNGSVYSNVEKLAS